MLVFAAACPLSASGYGLFILETAAALGIVAVAAWAAVRLANKRSIFGKRGTRLRSVERLALDARRSVHLVEVDGETVLLGVSEHSVTLLKTLSQKTNSAESKESQS